MDAELIAQLESGLGRGEIVPYLGPGVLGLVPGTSPVPATPEALAAALTARVTVPHKIRTRLTAAAQFIENFKHRKTLVTHMNAAFAARVAPTPLHALLAAAGPPLIVDAWYDAAMAEALAAAAGGAWGQVQALSQSDRLGEQPGRWFGFYDAAGAPVPEEAAASWRTLLYRPWGCVAPAANYLVSDSDFVEVLTEIDIQTPIPERVQQLRRGRRFLFLGCRFHDQLQRSFARQITKRSSDRHWAVIPGELTRNEARFLEELNIERIDADLSDLVERLTSSRAAAAPA